MFTPLIVLASVTLYCHAESLGPPKGAFGVLDWRYPDHIVDPLVECKTEGVFPHPRDCQWYYRCYDRYGFGFYWRAYFKCEPGTQFSDALDQCVHAGDPRECSPEPPVQPCSNIVDDCNLKQICPAGNLGTAFVKTVEICRTSFTKCPGKPDQAFCEPGSVYDNTNKVCIPENSLCRQSDPRPAPPDIVCEDEIGKCVDLTVCETETSEPRRQRLCNVMYNCVHSDGRKTTRSLCDPEYIFDTDSNECVSREAVASKQCPDTQLVSDVPVTCEKDSESCSLFEACETREMFLSCSSYFNCRETQQMRSDPLCGQTEAYSFKYGRCLSRPTYRQLLQSGGPYSPCLSTGIHPVPFAPDAPVEELIENYTCKALGDTPYAENHPQLRCKEAPACGIAGAQYRATRILCQDYFMCTSGGRNKLRLRRKTCGTGEYFNFTEMICTPEECPDVMPESSSSTTTTTTTPKSTDVNLSLELKIVCSKNGEVPILESNGHMRYCSVNVLCDENNSVLGVKHLCEQFYKCYLDEESGSLKAKLGSCTDPETLYDFSVAACVPKPTNLCKLDVRTRFLNMMEQFGWNFKANTGNEFAPPAFVGQESAISQIPGYTGNVASYLPAYSNNLPTQQQVYLSNSGNHNQGYYMGNTQTASQLSPTRFQNSGTVYNRAINFPGSEQQRLNMATNPQIQGQQQVNSNFNSYNYNQL